MNSDNTQELVGKRMKTGEDLISRSWRSYWEEPCLHRLERIHRAQSLYYAERLVSLVPIDPKTVALDFGCGFGFVSDALADKVEKMFLWDASNSMRNQARRFLAHRQNVQVIDSLRAMAFPVEPFDLIIANSVIQYMTVEEFSEWLRQWGKLLAPSGRVVLSDLIPTAPPSVFREIYEAMAFSAKRGLFASTMAVQLRHIGQYWNRGSLGALLRMGEDTLRQLAHPAGFSVEMLGANLTHLSGRRTAILSKMSR